MANALKGIGVTLLVWLIIIALVEFLKPTGDWGPLKIVIPVLAGFIYWLVTTIER